ncbi:MAG: hypothetical protein JOZ52_00945 [Acidobacteria bacterium]|nr:hypothetical protein [Acidobacteriota bacterium]
MLKTRNFTAILMAVIFAAVAVLIVPTKSNAVGSDNRKNAKAVSVEQPLNLAILIQDDLESRVGNELGVTKDFIRSLPAGSRVMVGYITTGSLQVRQQFTTDLDKAAGSLRIPRASESASPYNPYIEVIEALKKFDEGGNNRNAILLISDGLDVSRGFDATSAGNTVDLKRAIREANRRNVAIYSFYAPSEEGLTSRNHTAASYGQSSLNRLSNETGGRAFFQGTTGFVTFDSYFDRLRETLNEQYAKAY